MSPKKLFRLTVLILAVSILAVIAPPFHQADAAPLAQASNITLVEPTACPPTGCAAGQRLTYRLRFDLANSNQYVSGDNVYVCVFVPTSWLNPGSITFDGTGGVTGNQFNTSPTCLNASVTSDYGLLLAAVTSYQQGVVFDTLDISFRIGNPSVSGSPPPANGFVYVQIFEKTANNGLPTDWVGPERIYTDPMTPAPAAATSYVASSPSACTGNPCYLNSTGDLTGGIGAGLKDAIDAAPSSGGQVVVLGSVSLKGQAVRVNKALTIAGSGDATLTSSSTTCANPLLELTAGVTLRGLNLDDGSCASPNRTLVSVNAPGANTLIESNDLTGGGDAIRVAGGSGNLTVRYNHISNNSGYALFWEGNGAGGSLDMVANNLSANGQTVQCATGTGSTIDNRRVDHNYWGSPTLPNLAASRCQFGAGKHLGAPVKANTGAPGVVATRVTVSETAVAPFGGQISVRRSGGSDFDLYLVNHDAVVPFTSPSLGSPNPCSEIWDVFLAGGASGTLELTLKYNRSSACVAVIESSQFCAQTSDPAKYPLWWYDPVNSITGGWDTTGQKPAGSAAGSSETGQATACNMGQDTITVSIDSSGRPALNDLQYTPLMVGLPSTTTFRALASNQTATLQWTTLTEADLSGFIVMRASNAAGPFNPISDLITRRGSTLSGASYSFVDGGRTNGVIEYYRLQFIKTDNSVFYSDILSIVPNVATVTPTPTSTFTRTPFPSVTSAFRFNTATRVPTQLFAAATRPAGTPTRTPFGYTEPAPGLNEGYPGPTSEDGAPAGEDTPGSGYPAPASGTTMPNQSAPAPTGTPADANPSRDASEWISLVMGLLGSTVIVGGIFWYVYRRNKTEPRG